ncbi:MAG: hypothetical protein U0031_18945 [Thermomicrobiales bacterium]
MVDQFLGGLFGSNDNDDEQTRHRRARDFADRHHRGAHDQMSDEEVLQNYRAATSHLAPDEYRQMATESLNQLTPEQRRELRRELKHRSQDRYDPRDDSPQELANAMQRAHQDQGGGLASLFGMGGSHSNAQAQPQDKPFGGMFDNPLAKVALAGMAAVAAKKITEPR